MSDLGWLIFTFGSGTAISWLIWSIQIPKWRLYAYNLVDDIDELKRRAVAAQIIWPEGHIFQKTEIASLALRQEILQLEKFKKSQRGQNKRSVP